MLKAYILRRSYLRKLHFSALRAQKRGQKEVCGVLASDENGRLELRFMTNRIQRAGRFTIARADYLKARESGRRTCKRVLRTFHSNPIGEAIPSRGHFS